MCSVMSFTLISLSPWTIDLGDDRTGSKNMQTRLLSCIAGGLLGVALTSTINSSLGLNPTLALVAIAGLGVAAGYVVSILFDVFAGSGKSLDSVK